jgi:hypothetical protein
MIKITCFIIGILFILLYLYLVFFKAEKISESKFWYVGWIGSLLILAFGGRFLIDTGWF